jgi:hypothetical protein
MPIRDPTNFNGHRPPGQNATVHPVVRDPCSTLLEPSALGFTGLLFRPGAKSRPPDRRRGDGSVAVACFCMPFPRVQRTCALPPRVVEADRHAILAFWFSCFLPDGDGRGRRGRQEQRKKANPCHATRGYMRAASRANDKPLVKCPSPLRRQASRQTPPKTRGIGTPDANGQRTTATTNGLLLQGLLPRQLVSAPRPPLMADMPRSRKRR